MTLEYTDTKELVAERFNRLIQSNQAIREEYLDYQVERKTSSFR